ncbi:cytochrome P450 4C1-like [Chrysoperla carnea]|uniref:cytochrome P450 4C1-like n=1 Tax=Chrysoperla carnea TaxID=189513 RepID=UPI001D077F07|nr:cytochrome P450 4C1-like [Chrysoperla carnea]
MQYTVWEPLLHSSTYFLLKYTLLTIIVISVIKFYWDRRRLYICALKFSGPTAIPLLGNALLFAVQPEDILNRIYEIVCKYSSPCRLWFGHKLMTIIYAPEDLEVVLSDTVNIKKDHTYSFIEPFLGQGLISNSGSLWKTHRRLIIPTFTSKTLRYYVESFNTHAKTLVEKLQPIAERKETVNIIDPLNLCTVDIVLSTILGIEAGAQDHKIDEFVEHVELGYKMVAERMFKGWLHLDAIFRLSKCYRNTMKAQKVIHDFARKQLTTLKAEFNQKYQDGLIDEHNVRTTLEHLLLINKKGDDFFTDVELRDETYTLFTASQDTVATECAFILLMLAMHPEIQEKVYKEILEVSGETKDYYTEWETYPEFKYLEMVIKESLRLFPIGPTIMREVIQDIKLKNDIVIPKGAGVMVVMYRTHRLPEYWTEPEKFIPERFLPELCEKRHPFAYVPFSFGPRSCIAPKYAMAAMKTIVTHVIRSYKVTSEDKFEDLQLCSDISTRSRNGYKMKIELRK